MAWLLLVLSLTLANFIYCLITNKPKIVALERSFFQAVAILICWETHPWRY